MHSARATLRRGLEAERIDVQNADEMEVEATIYIVASTSRKRPERFSVCPEGMRRLICKL